MKLSVACRSPFKFCLIICKSAAGKSRRLIVRPYGVKNSAAEMMGTIDPLGLSNCGNNR